MKKKKLYSVLLCCCLLMSMGDHFQVMGGEARAAAILVDMQIGSRPADMEEMLRLHKQKAYRKQVKYVENTVLFIRDEDRLPASASSRSSCDDTRSWEAELSQELEEYGICAIEPQGELGNAVVYPNTSSRSASGRRQMLYKALLEKNNVWEAVEQLNRREDILIAEPDYLYQGGEIRIPTESSDEKRGTQWYLDSLNAEALWNRMGEKCQLPGQDVVVAVIDTGIAFDHSDLQANMWVNLEEKNGITGVDDDGDGYIDDIYGVNLIHQEQSPYDDNGHGTQVAGVIGMSPYNGGGVGIAYGARLMAVKAGTVNNTFSVSRVVSGVRYAVRHGADVINMSFGGYGNSYILQSVLLEASSHCVLVASAGNDGYPTSNGMITPNGDMYPAAYHFVLGVMAQDQIGNLSLFSNWDFASDDMPDKERKYEIAAPGNYIYTTTMGGGYINADGTSLAAPMVSAAAAVIAGCNKKEEGYRPEAVKDCMIRRMAGKVSYTDMQGAVHKYPRLNLLDIVEEDNENPGTETPGTELPGIAPPDTENPGTEKPGTDPPGNSGGEKVQSPARPAAPTLRQVIQRKNGMVYLKWKKVKHVTGYQIFYAKRKKGPYFKFGTTKKNVSSYKRKKSTKRMYYYRIKGYKKTGNKIRTSVYSNYKKSVCK